MMLPPQALIDIDKFAPPPGKEVDKTPEWRWSLAFNKALQHRSPDRQVAALVNKTEKVTLDRFSDNLRMRLLIALRPADERALPHLGAQVARMRLYAGLAFDEEFQGQSRRLGSRVARRFYEALGGRDLNDAWAKSSEDDRLDVVIGLLHAYGHESGFMPPEKIESELEEPDENNRIRAASYRPHKDILWLNTHPVAQWEDAVETLASAGHETTHKMQRDMAALLMMEQRPDLVGEEASKKALFETDAERIAAWYFMDNLRFGHIGSDEQEIGYKYQPLEVHARLVEDAIRQTLNRHLVLGLDQDVITAVTADDLAELGLDMKDIRSDNQPRKFGLN